MKIRSIAAIALASVAAISLTACRDSRDTGSGASTDVKIMVGGIDKVIYLPAKLTEQLGYFKDQGLNVQLLTEPAGATAENTLISGDVQGVVGFYDHTIDLQTKGKCITSVVQFADVPGEVEVVGAAQADKIKSPADFKGRKLGFTSPGSSTDFLTQYLATKNGVATTEYTGVKAGAGQTFVAALDQGGIDAGMTTDPTVAQLVSTGKGKVLVDMRTVEGTKAALGGLYPASSLYMDCKYVNDHKDVVQKLANAFVKTLGFVNSHSAEEIAAKMPADFANGGKELYAKSINDTKPMFNRDGKMKAEGARNVLDVLSQFSPNVKGRKDSVDLAKTYTTEFADKAAG
ncbi:transporter substrate-binding domain-containing protein [Solihabitans fulvus]|uniref:Transporter substrate-binding domain-containing protein n=1 Tax=Solihabitans fulvus TaxID=1892852 RepID=A0A5B2X6C6_9PSEU|nr:ABC transporter substrate-binding protein [Solihabitans fulvus]KAA2258783.1 transporter substrate-binding domain-containing protein [Solihabitans fulvus]